jgi:NAD-dependent SIR2 family protein deacetylase
VVKPQMTKWTLAPHALKPTSSHLAIRRLLDAGRIHAVITTNVDGLHLASGVPRERLSELHGNACIEECRTCGMRFQRDFVTRTATGLFEHETGRRCDKCGSALYDNVVNFGNTHEHVPSMEAEHDRAWVDCMKADLCVVFGSSLSVQTACDLPEECLAARCDKASGGRLVIVNLQRTPKDDLASMRIFATCDSVLQTIEKELLFTIP